MCLQKIDHRGDKNGNNIAMYMKNVKNVWFNSSLKKRLSINAFKVLK